MARCRPLTGTDGRPHYTQAVTLPQLSIHELAASAGVETAYVERLVELGILAPAGAGFSSGDARRVGILQSLERGGLPLTALGEAVRRGAVSFDFVDQPSYERFGTMSTETFRSVSDRTGIPIEELMLLREAMGFPQPAATDPLRLDEVDIVPLLEFWHSNHFRPALIQRSLRTFGRSLRQIAETEADAFRSEILGPLFASGRTPGEVGRDLARLDPNFGDATDRALLAIFHAQQANAWMKNIFEGFEATLASAGLHDRLDHPPAICFLDLSGYTRLTEERGDDAAADLAARLERLVQRAAIQHGGKAVKFLGDGVMFHFPSPGRGVEAALDMVESARTEGLPPAHVGIHAGPVLFQGGDYFGRTVNVAARIADYARQGEVVASQDVVDAAGDAPVRFTEIGPVELKGVSGPVTLHVAGRHAARSRASA